MNTIVIKKYPNRKYYTNGKYVNINHILDLVSTDQEFLVVDNVTKRDITLETTLSALFTHVKTSRIDVSRTFVKQVLATISNGETL